MKRRAGQFMNMNLNGTNLIRAENYRVLLMARFVMKFYNLRRGDFEGFR